MSCHQLTPGERHVLSALRKQGLWQAAIARAMERLPSTVRRELRRNQRFSAANWALITSLIEQLRSPELIAGRLVEERRLRISHETIYRYVWNDRREMPPSAGTCDWPRSSDASAELATTAGARYRAKARSPSDRPGRSTDPGSGIWRVTP